MTFNERRKRIKTGGLGGMWRQRAEKKSRRKCFTYNGLQSRGDWTPVKLFLQGAASIEAHIRRLILAFVQGTPPPH